MSFTKPDTPTPVLRRCLLDTVRSARAVIWATMHNLIVLVCGLLVCAASAVAEPPSLDGFFPAGAQRGHETTIQAVGKFDDQPLSIWSATEGITGTAKKNKRGEFVVTIDPDVAPGRHWIRLFNSEGATRLRPFIVETVNEIREADAQANLELSAPSVVNGRLTKNDEVDTYRFHLEQDQTLAVTVTANRYLGSPMDTVMQLVDLDNRVVVLQSDDAPLRDPRILYQAPRSGQFGIRLFAFPETPAQRIGFAGGKDFIYRLAVSTSGIVTSAWPLTARREQLASIAKIGLNCADTKADHAVRDEHVIVFQDGLPGWGEAHFSEHHCITEVHDSTRGAPLDCELPFSVSGHFVDGDRRDFYRFTAMKDKRLRLTVNARQLGSPVDPVLQIFDDAGNELAKKDDTKGRDCLLDFKVPANGRYHAVVQDLYGNTGPWHRYNLQVEPITAMVRLSVDTEVFTVKSGQELKIQVKIDRRDGFREPVLLTADGLPASVRVDEVTSAATGDTAKEVTLTLKATEPISLPFRIHTSVAERAVPAKVSTVAGSHETAALWLTVR